LEGLCKHRFFVVGRKALHAVKRVHVADNPIGRQARTLYIYKAGVGRNGSIHALCKLFAGGRVGRFPADKRHTFHGTDHSRATAFVPRGGSSTIERGEKKTPRSPAALF
jgi:hypothetical protein